MIGRIIMISRIIMITIFRWIIVHFQAYFHVWKGCLHSVTNQPDQRPTDIILYRVSFDTK